MKSKGLASPCVYSINFDTFLKGHFDIHDVQYRFLKDCLIPRKRRTFRRHLYFILRLFALLRNFTVTENNWYHLTYVPLDKVYTSVLEIRLSRD